MDQERTAEKSLILVCSTPFYFYFYSHLLSLSKVQDLTLSKEYNWCGLKEKTCHHLLPNAWKLEFDLYLRESRSRRPNFRCGSEGHLGGSYGSYKLQIPQLTKKRAMIFKIVVTTTDDGHIAI